MSSVVIRAMGLGVRGLASTLALPQSVTKAMFFSGDL
jgi:hypothetical protein